MSLISLVLVLAIIGFVCWIVLQVPMPAIMRNIIVGVVVLFVVLFLLQSFGLVGSLSQIRIK